MQSLLTGLIMWNSVCTCLHAWGQRSCLVVASRIERRKGNCLQFLHVNSLSLSRSLSLSLSLSLSHALSLHTHKHIQGLLSLTPNAHQWRTRTECSILAFNTLYWDNTFTVPEIILIFFFNHDKKIVNSDQTRHWTKKYIKWHKFATVSQK